MLFHIYTAFTLLFAHWISDFIFQTEHIANTKSKSLKSLTTHVGILSLVLFFMLIGFPTIGIFVLLKFIVLNGLSHWIIDYITSKEMSKAYEKGELRKFFNILGLDQMLHIGILFGLWTWLL